MAMVIGTPRCFRAGLGGRVQRRRAGNKAGLPASSWYDEVTSSRVETSMQAAAKLIHVPVEYYRQMRATQPVAYDPKFKSWNVFRYDDALRILNDHATFSSQSPGQGRETALPSIVGMDPP